MFDLNELPDGDGLGAHDAPVIELGGHSYQAVVVCDVVGKQSLDVRARGFQDGGVPDVTRASKIVDFSSIAAGSERLSRYDVYTSRAAASPQINLDVGLSIQSDSVTRSIQGVTYVESSRGIGTPSLTQKLEEKTCAAVDTRSDCTKDFFSRSFKFTEASTSEKVVISHEENNVDSRPTQLTPPFLVPGPSKRAREDDSVNAQAAAFQHGIKAKRLASCDSPGKSIEAGAGLANSSGRVGVKYVSVDEDEMEGATTLLLGEGSNPRFKAHNGVGVYAPSGGNNMLSLNVISLSARSPVRKEADLSVGKGSVEDEASLDGAYHGRIQRTLNVSEQTPEFPNPVRSFWVGQIRAENFGPADVAAYSSDKIPPGSLLRNLPNILTVEKVSKLQELLEAIRLGLVFDPVIRMKHVLSPADKGKSDSLGGIFQSSWRHKPGTVKAGNNRMDLRLGVNKEPGDHDMGPPGFTDTADERYVAVVKFKDHPFPSLGRRNCNRLYLVLDSVAEAVCETNGLFRKKFEREIIEYGNVEESTLYGVLCQSPDRDRSTRPRSGDELMADVVEPLGTKDSSRSVLPESSGKVGNKRLITGAKRQSIEPISRDSLVRTEYLESSEKDMSTVLKSKESKDTECETSHDTHRSEKSKVRKDTAQKQRLKEREKDRDFRGKEREERSITRETLKHPARSGERQKGYDSTKRDKVREKEAERGREKVRDRHSDRDLLERSKRVKDLERENSRDRVKEKEKEVILRKRGRLAPELDNVKLVATADDEDVAPGFGPQAKVVPGEGTSAVTLSGKDIRRRGKIVDEDIPLDEKEVFELDSPAQERTVITTKTRYVSTAKGMNDALPRASEGEVAGSAGFEKKRKKVINAQIGSMDLKSGIRNDPKSAELKVKSGLLTHPDGGVPSVTGLSATESTRTNQDSMKGKTVNLSLKNSNTVNELCQVHSGTPNKYNEVGEGTSEIDGNGRRMTGLGIKFGAQPVDSKNADDMDTSAIGDALLCPKPGGPVLPLRGRLTNSGLGADEELTAVERSGVGESNLRDSTKAKDVNHPSKTKLPLSVRVDNALDARTARKSEGRANYQDLGRPSDYARMDDGLIALSTGQSSPLRDNALSTPIAALQREVTLDVLLQACDKDTRAWLGSATNAAYLAEEFGVCISKIEEIPGAKLESWPKHQQGPVNVKVTLMTDKSADADEARWFIHQAADTLRAVASRGVFAKCLWYQGPVQRFTGDQAPSVQAVVRKLKGEDGKNLERIQDGTGVLLGIVSDGSNRKVIANPTRVIGLRLKCVRKKGFAEANRQVEELLSQVADQLLEEVEAGAAPTQDVGLSRVERLSTTSPASEVLTPVHKDVFAAYSPLSPDATVTPIAVSLYGKTEESSVDVKVLHGRAVSAIPVSGVTVERVSTQLLQVLPEDEDQPLVLKSTNINVSGRVLYISQLPSFASASMLKELLEDVLKSNRTDLFSLSSSDGGMPEVVRDISIDTDCQCAFVEFSSDELLKTIMKAYLEDRMTFYGLKLEPRDSASMKKKKLMMKNKVEELDDGVGPQEPSTLSMIRRGKEVLRLEGSAGGFAGERSSTDSDDDGVSRARKYVRKDSNVRLPGRLLEQPRPLFLTELVRNASAQSIHNLFEDIIEKYVSPSIRSSTGRHPVLDVRFIPSRGCAFVDLATSELVDLVLDLYSQSPDLFDNMKMDLGRLPSAAQTDDDVQISSREKRLNPSNRHALGDDRLYSSIKKSSRQYASVSPPRREKAAVGHDIVDDYEEEGEDERQQTVLRKRSSDPERTVYADRLPDNVSEGLIRRIFERVLREHMSEEQRELIGDHAIAEVRHVPTKFCAFIVFVREDLTRLVLKLYNRDEGIFENMRLKPHFDSRLGDIYSDEPHVRGDGAAYRLSSRDLLNRRRLRGYDDYYHHTDTSESVRGRTFTAPRPVVSTAFKEVDRRRSVYVDRIPERMPEPAMRDLFERILRQTRRSLVASCSVSQVTFFRDKFDPDKLCAFVELDNENFVPEILEAYTEDEHAFNGMRVRPALRYGH